MHHVCSCVRGSMMMDEPQMNGVTAIPADTNRCDTHGYYTCWPTGTNGLSPSVFIKNSNRCLSRFPWDLSLLKFKSSSHFTPLKGYDLCHIELSSPWHNCFNFWELNEQICTNTTDSRVSQSFLEDLQFCHSIKENDVSLEDSGLTAAKTL